MGEGSQGVVFLVAIICAVAVILIVADAATEILRRRTWSRDFLMEAQPASRLELRTAHSVLRRLDTACRRQGREFPVLTTMALDETRAQVFLAVPSEKAPQPWTAAEDGASWQVALDALDAEPVTPDDPGEPADEPRAPELFVGAGRTASASLLINLAACPGLISLEGPARVRHMLIRRWIHELTEPAWRLDVNALVVGDPTLVSGRASDASGSLRADSARDFPGGLLMIGATGEAERVEAVLQRAQTDGHRKAAGVVDGRTSRAAWRFRVLDNGTVRSGIFPPADWRQTPELRAEPDPAASVGRPDLAHGPDPLGEAASACASEEGSSPPSKEHP